MKATFKTHKLLILCASSVLFLSSCATTHEQSVYHDSAYNDHNRAPAAMSPPLSAEGLIDQTHLRSQADYHYAMGESYSLEGQRKQAIEAFKMTLVYDPQSAAVRRRLATEYVRAGLISEALEQANISLEKEPEHIETLMLLAGLHSAMKTYDKALSYYEKVLKIQPDHLEAPLYMGAIWSEQKQYTKAIKAFEALAKNPDYSTPHLAWYYVGRVYLDMNDKRALGLAEKSFLQSLALKAEQPDTALALASVYQKQQNNKKAEESLVRWQRESGPHPKVAEVLAHSYLEKNLHDEAFEQLEVLEKFGEDQLSTKLKMALILIEKKMYSEAAVKLEEIIKEAPESDKVRFYLGAVYEETKKDQQAIFHFKKVPFESQYSTEAVLHAAYLLKGQGKLDEAVSHIEAFLKQKDDQPQVYAMLASLLDEKMEHAKAEKLLTDAIAKFPDHAQLRFYYGIILDRLGQKDRMMSEMKKLIEIDPTHAQGLNYLAFTYAETGHNLDEAEKLARKATEIDPQDGYILDTLGWVLYKQNKNTEAIRYLEAAQRIQPTVSVIAEHLGDAYLKGEMSERALEMYNRALQHESDPKKKNEIQIKITSLENQQPYKEVNTRIPASVMHDNSKEASP